MTIACPDCDLLQQLPPLSGRATAFCTRCHTSLETTNGRSMTAALACAIATFVLLFPLNIFPLLHMNMFGMHAENVITAGVLGLWGRQWILLAGLSAIFVVFLPFLRFGLLIAVLATIRLGHRGAWLGPAFRWSMWLDMWAMLDVFLLAACVGFYRLDNVSQAHLGIARGGQCFIAAALLTMLCRATLDKRTVWRTIGGTSVINPGESTIACTTCDLVQPLSQEGQPCPRCGLTLHVRKPEAMTRTAALSLAAFFLFFPANFFPMDITNRLGTQEGYTIFDGIMSLISNGLWPLGALIFCTSIAIPMGKILVIFWCLLSVRRRSRQHLIRRTKLLHLVAEFGRWSKTDPFVIVFFVPLMHFGGLGSDDAGWGATAFIVMSVLTMIASVTFDPRLMWDAAERRSHG